MDGVLIVNKPLNKTSFDVVRDVRKEYNTKKVGHIGTLDPMASGVLPILIGKATKLSDLLMEHDKDYIATLKLGEKRDTGDQEGKIIESSPIPEDLSEIKITNTLNSFLGDSFQIPPMYSAIKINGQKLYDLARKGETIERKPRPITITNIVLLNFNKDNNEIEFKVTCSKGTYIRVLCEDIATKLNTCGYMSSLKRTRVGTFTIENENKFIEIKDIFTDIQTIEINQNDIKKLINGVPIKINSNNDLSNDLDSNLKNGICNLTSNGTYLGIGDIKNNSIKRKILTFI